MKSHNAESKPSTSFVTSLVQYMASTFFGRTLSLAGNFASTNLHFNDISNCIIPGLFLGIIPVKRSICGQRCTNTHLRIINEVNNTDRTRPLELIVSVVKQDELTGSGFLGFTMVDIKDWEERRIAHRLLEMGDLRAEVNNRAVIETLHQMKRCIDDGKSVYVHCKAGRGRSAMICAIYLAAFVQNPTSRALYSIDEALKFLSNRRKQVDLTVGQIYKAREILAEMRREFKQELTNERKPEQIPFKK